MNGSFRTMIVLRMRSPANGIGSPGVLVECRLSFLMQVDGMGYTEAVKILCEQTPVYVSQSRTSPRKKPFSLPFPNDSFTGYRRYLNQRGIRDEVLDYCVQLGILYESVAMAFTITLFLLAWMNREKQSMRFCVGFMTAGERSFF